MCQSPPRAPRRPTRGTAPRGSGRFAARAPPLIPPGPGATGSTRASGAALSRPRASRCPAPARLRRVAGHRLRVVVATPAGADADADARFAHVLHPAFEGAAAFVGDVYYVTDLRTGEPLPGWPPSPAYANRRDPTARGDDATAARTSRAPLARRVRLAIGLRLPPRLPRLFEKGTPRAPRGGGDDGPEPERERDDAADPTEKTRSSKEPSTTPIPTLPASSLPASSLGASAYFLDAESALRWADACRRPFGLDDRSSVLAFEHGGGFFDPSASSDFFLGGSSSSSARLSDDGSSSSFLADLLGLFFPPAPLLVAFPPPRRRLLRPSDRPLAAGRRLVVPPVGRTRRSRPVGRPTLAAKRGFAGTRDEDREAAIRVSDDALEDVHESAAEAFRNLPKSSDPSKASASLRLAPALTSAACVGANPAVVADGLAETVGPLLTGYGCDDEGDGWSLRGAAWATPAGLSEAGGDRFEGDEGDDEAHVNDGGYSEAAAAYRRSRGAATALPEKGEGRESRRGDDAPTGSTDAGGVLGGASRRKDSNVRAFEYSTLSWRGVASRVARRARACSGLGREEKDANAAVRASPETKKSADSGSSVGSDPSELEGRARDYLIARCIAGARTVGEAPVDHRRPPPIAKPVFSSPAVHVVLPTRRTRPTRRM